MSLINFRNVNTQCGNWRTILPLRFYVKSILLFPEAQNLQLWVGTVLAGSRLWVWIFRWVKVRLQKFTKPKINFEMFKLHIPKIIDFTKNLSGRKFLKFPHCGMPTLLEDEVVDTLLLVPELLLVELLDGNPRIPFILV